MTRRSRPVVLAVILALVAALGAAAPAAASPLCGSNPEFRAYDSNGQVGLLGWQCPQVQGEGVDANFGDSTDGFRGSDNDAMNSWKFYNPTSVVWCLQVYADSGFSGASLVYTLGPTSSWWGPTGGTMPSGWNNRVSSVVFWDRVGGSC